MTDLKTPRMTFSEFSQLSDEAGFTTSPEQKEVDYWLGRTMADVVDTIHDLVETSPPPVSLAELAQVVEDLSRITLETITTGQIELIRSQAISLVAATTRALAYVCRDDGAD